MMGLIAGWDTTATKPRAGTGFSREGYQGVTGYPVQFKHQFTDRSSRRDSHRGQETNRHQENSQGLDSI